MTDYFVEQAKKFHRQSPLAVRDASSEEAKFARENRGASESEDPKAPTYREQVSKNIERAKKQKGKDCDAVSDPDLIAVDAEFTPVQQAKQKENAELAKKEKKFTVGNKTYPDKGKDEWSPEAREKAAEARKGGEQINSKQEHDPKIRGSLANYRERIYQARTKQLRSK